jgi:nucleotide-binding universal stress UspA family protein
MEFRKILVPVSGTAADDEAVRLACRLSKKHKGKIWAVYIIPVKRMLPLDAEIDGDIKPAETLLDHVEDIAEEADCEISTDLIQAREVGPAIIDEAIEQDVDLIIFGATYRKRFGQFTIGDVIPYVLKNASCRVILLHEPPKTE